MSEINHSERAHAFLSASGSHIWLHCTPSARLAEHIPERGSKVAADKGTLQHELTDSFMRLFLGEIQPHDHEQNMIGIRGNPLWEESFLEKVTSAVTYGISAIQLAWDDYGRENVLVLVEQRADFGEWVPEGFGSADLIIVAPDYVHVIDWKYGSVKVDAKDNPQMRLYGVATLRKYEVLHDIKRVEMTIVQPHIDHIDHEVMDAQDLLEWVETVVRPRAQMAWDGKGEFNPSDETCRWCRARGQCRARADKKLADAGDLFRLPTTLTDNELADLFLKLPGLKSWLDDIATEVESRVIESKQPMPGLKVVEGKSSRLITDPVTARQRLLQAGFTEDDICEPLPQGRKLLGLTALEKIVGKKAFKDVLADVVVKPSGKPTVVSVDDPRQELQPASDSPENTF